MSESNKRVTGVSKSHSWSMFGFSFILTILFIWLGGFVIGDINSIEKPNRYKIERKHVDQSLINKKYRLDKEIEDISKSIKVKGERKSTLSSSTEESQKTMTQLIEIQKQRMEKNISISQPEKMAFAESQKIFLSNQSNLQRIIIEIQKLRDKQRTLQADSNKIQLKIDRQKHPANEEYRQLWKKREHKVVFLKLVFIIPLLIFGLWLTTKKRKSKFLSIIYSLDVAVLWHLICVIHQHFPSRYYKYIFIIAAISAILSIIVYLTRLKYKPNRMRLLQRYEEAYFRNKCPVCNFTFYPAGGNSQQKTLVGEHEYTCPSCGTEVFEKCLSCEQVKHSLLEYCKHCGDKKDIFSDDESITLNISM